MHDEAKQYIIAAVVATEVPPDAPEEEFKAVIDVIRNRAGRSTLNKQVRVVLAKNQFSAVCREDYWRKALSGDWLPNHVTRCLELVKQDWPDTTDGAMYYYSPISMIPKWSSPPWAERFIEREVNGVRKDYFRFYFGEYILV